MLEQYDHQISEQTYDICVVGAGPLGIAVALECAKSGRKVLLVEGGSCSPNLSYQLPLEGDRATNHHHSPPELTRARGLGGTSQIWGGRCLPLDDIDFEDRPYSAEARWPIGHQDLKPYYERAAEFLGIEDCTFRIDYPRLNNGSNLQCDRLEVWLNQIDMGVRYRAEIEACRTLTLLYGATVAAIEPDTPHKRLSHLVLTDGAFRSQIKARRTILACGGIDTTRLLLAAQARHDSMFGGPAGPLGSYYMGHLTGVIADLILEDPMTIQDFDFFRQGDFFVRRRLTLRDEIQRVRNIGNIAFWPENPPIFDPSHRSGFLSLLWLVLQNPIVGPRLLPAPYRHKMLGPLPHRIWPHLANFLRSPGSAFFHTARTAWDRYFARTKKPAHLRRNAAGRYALCYHSEHKPDVRSKVTLSRRRDTLGRSSLDLALRFDEEDARSVIEAHRILDDALREAGIGRLEYRNQPADLIEDVLRQACDGRHQLGTTRMGSDPRESVVDSDSRIHDLLDTYIASSSTFVTSGSANPTLAGLALALRVANRVLQSLAQGERDDNN